MATTPILVRASYRQEPGNKAWSQT